MKTVRTKSIADGVSTSGSAPVAVGVLWVTGRGIKSHAKHIEVGPRLDDHATTRPIDDDSPLSFWKIGAQLRQLSLGKHRLRATIAAAVVMASSVIAVQRPPLLAT